MPRSTFLRVRPPVSILSIRARYSPSILFREYTVIEHPVSHFPFLVLVFGTLYFAVRTNDKTTFPVYLMRRPIFGASNIYPRRQLRKEGVARAFKDLLRNKSTITKEILTVKWIHCTNTRCEVTLIALQERKSISLSILCKFPQRKKFNECNSKILNNSLQKYVKKIPKENCYSIVYKYFLRLIING